MLLADVVTTPSDPEKELDKQLSYVSGKSYDPDAFASHRSHGSNKSFDPDTLIVDAVMPHDIAMECLTDTRNLHFKALRCIVNHCTGFYASNEYFLTEDMHDRVKYARLQPQRPRTLRLARLEEPTLRNSRHTLHTSCARPRRAAVRGA